MTEIRALTIRQPWAALIAHDDKRVENRTWGTAWRGQLLIHAAKTADPFESDAGPIAGDQVRSAIVATATLADCHLCECATTGSADCQVCGCDLWAEPGRFHWVLEDVRALPEPVLCSGSLGLWRPREDVLQVVFNGIAVPS
jgi:hypothetical protein